jgi:hypothetical protein
VHGSCTSQSATNYSCSCYSGWSGTTCSTAQPADSTSSSDVMGLPIGVVAGGASAFVVVALVVGSCWYRRRRSHDSEPEPYISLVDREKA